MRIIPLGSTEASGRPGRVQLPKIEYSRRSKEESRTRANLLEINKLAAGYFYYQLRREGGKTGTRISDRQRTQ